MSGGDSGVSLTSCTEDGLASDCDSGTGGGHTVTIQVNSPRGEGDLVARGHRGPLATMSSMSPAMSALSPALSRSGSTSSLASSLSCAPVQEVRSLTANFQRLLAQATREIKKLTAEKVGLEQEQERLLTVNVELAMETKKLLEQQKEWEEQEKGLIRANEEFVAEVERLYQEEERWEHEAEQSRREAEELSRRLTEEVEQAREEAERERAAHRGEEERLVESVRILTLDNDRLLQEREREKATNSRTHTELKQEFQEELTRLQATVSCLQAELEVELTAREEAEAEAEKLAAETEKLQAEVERARQEGREEVRGVRSGLEAKLSQVEKRGEKVAAENFELSLDSENLSKKLKLSQEAVRRMERELGQVNVEKEWLISQQKSAVGSSEKAGELATTLENTKVELREEKTKVKNLADWKSQLADKNKELKEENSRLVRRIENLEHLMNEEQTDISEMLSVITNIQAGKEVVDMKSLKKRYM